MDWRKTQRRKLSGDVLDALESQQSVMAEVYKESYRLGRHVSQ